MKTTIDALVEALEAEKEMRLYGKLPECGKEQESLLERRRAVYEATDAALAQARAEQAEPVVWRHKLSGHFTTISSVSNSQGWEPLYTAPTAAPVAKLEPLTPDELRKDNTLMSSNATMSLSLDQLSELADAVTAIHNAKLGAK